MSDRPRQCGSDRQNDNKLVLEIFVNVSCLLALRGIVSLGKLIFERIEKQSCFSRIACQSKKEKLLISFYEIATSQTTAKNAARTFEKIAVNENQSNNTRRSFERRSIGKSADVRRPCIRSRREDTPHRHVRKRT